MRKNDEKRFFGILRDLEQDPRVRKLECYRQHKGNTTFRHCRSVAVASFRMAQRLGWRVDERALARGAMLHDYHLYTRQNKLLHSLRHLVEHPKRACRNASRAFALSGKERNIIESHMWPLTPLRVPRSKEALLVMLADKYCAFREMRGHRD